MKKQNHVCFLSVLTAVKFGSSVCQCLLLLSYAGKILQKVKERTFHINMFEPYIIYSFDDRQT